MCLVKLVSLNSQRRQYPYSKNRVFLSVIILVLSTIFALTLLLSEALLVLYYFLSTFIVATITFFLKKYLYRLLIIGESRDDDEEKETDHAPWKSLLIAFSMLIGFIAVPLLLAGLLSGAFWFLMITSFTSGVSISEIVLYLQASGSR